MCLLLGKKYYKKTLGQEVYTALTDLNTAYSSRAVYTT